MSEVSTSHNFWKSIRFALILAAMQVGGGLLLTLAKSRGLIDGEAVTRGVLVLIGLCIAAIGNKIPKTSDGPPPQTLTHAALRQKVLRAAGWSMMLGGLAFASLWAFAPLDVARVASITVLGGSMAVMCGFVASWIYAYHCRSEP